MTSLTRTTQRSPAPVSTTLRRAMRRTPPAAVAVLAAFALALPAVAADGSPNFSKRRDRDVTIIIIDDEDHDRKRVVPETKRKPQAATTFQRPDREIRIRLPRKSGGGSNATNGPKVIIVDRNARACKGSGVCVVRP